VDGEKKISGDSAAADASGDKVDGTEEKKEVVGDNKIAEVAAAAAQTEGVQKEADTDMTNAAADKPESAEGSSAAVEGEVKHAREEGDGDKNEDEPSAKKQKVVV